MSSSCVPPKGCVLHDPDPEGQEEYDTVSECGSLCTCTSGSLTSLAEIRESERAGRVGCRDTAERVGRAESRNLLRAGGDESRNRERVHQSASGNGERVRQDHRNPERVENPGRVTRGRGRNPERAGRGMSRNPGNRNRARLSRTETLHQEDRPLTSVVAVSNGSRGTTQASDSNNNPYTIMFLPSQAMNESGRCGMCQRRLPIYSAVKVSLQTACEFLPWVAGLVIIYYCFLWWGIGSSFCAFLLMMGTHAVMRFMKTRGALQWPTYLPTRNNQHPTVSESEDDEDEENTTETGYEPVPDMSAEKPPSYEAAVVKPPPYDLQYHLTPTQLPKGQVMSCKVASSQVTSGQQQEVEIPMVSPPKLDIDEDTFLPSYQDAVALTDTTHTVQTQHMAQIQHTDTTHTEQMQYTDTTHPAQTQHMAQLQHTDTTHTAPMQHTDTTHTTQTQHMAQLQNTDTTHTAPMQHTDTTHTAQAQLTDTTQTAQIQFKDTVPTAQTHHTDTTHTAQTQHTHADTAQTQHT